MSFKVLVIDDHPLVQDGVSAALKSLADDVRVMAARDAEEGLAAAAANPDLDLVLLDLALPGMSGFDLIGKLHERLPSLPVVVLSALEEPESVRQAISAGAMGFVPKSAATRVLIEVLHQVLEGNVTVPSALRSRGRVANGSSRPAGAADSTGANESTTITGPGTAPGFSSSMSSTGAGGESMPIAEPDVALLTIRQLEVLSRLCQGKTNKQIATDLGLSEKTVKAHVTAIFKVLGVVNRTQAVLVARRVGMITA